MRTLKLRKLMPKYGPKTLYISTRGGNMRMKMMMMFIIVKGEMQVARAFAECIEPIEASENVSLCLEQSS
jgi:hypothetical protein